MIEQISIALINESGDFIPLEKATQTHIEMKIETAIADIFSNICRRLNDLTDDEIKLAEKFHLALHLKNYLEEIKENADHRTTN